MVWEMTKEACWPGASGHATNTAAPTLVAASRLGDEEIVEKSCPSGTGLKKYKRTYLICHSLF